MKKNLLKASAFLGLAISAFVLASCGESAEASTEVVNTTTTETLPATEEMPETVEITDLDG